MKSARDKLNQFHIYMALAVSTILGTLLGSLVVFAFTLVILLGVAFVSGDIRLPRR